MPIDKTNAPTITALLQALAQRAQTIDDLASRLGTGHIWRSLDGNLAVDIPDVERQRMEAFVDQYCNEAETIITTIRAALRAP